MENVSARIRSAGYTADKPVLKNVMLTLGKGEVLLIAGRTGSGKSTLILALTGVLSNLLDGYVDGDISVFGVDPLTPEGFANIPRIVGVVLQSHELQIAMQTPIDEVMFTLENMGVKNPLEEGYKILERYGLHGKAERDVEELSGGEKKRLCLASSTAHQPKLLILDEPTANLDPWGVSELLNQVITMKRNGVSIIITEHKPEKFMQLADKVAVMEDRTLKYGDIHVKRYTKILKPKFRKGGCKEDYSCIIDDLWFRYRGTYPFVLKGLSMKLKAGCIYAIVGANGSGKTTLGKIVAGLYRPVMGEVLVYGRRPWLLKSDELLKLVIYLPQEPTYMFVSSSVKDEFKLASKHSGIGWREVVKTSYPEFNMVIDASPYMLSYGQKRMLLYLLASVYGSKIVVLDEATSGLDPLLVKELFSWLERFKEKGGTALLLTHDERTLNIADEVYLLKRGVAFKVDRDKAAEYLGKPKAGDE